MYIFNMIGLKEFFLAVVLFEIDFVWLCFFGRQWEIFSYSFVNTHFPSILPFEAINFVLARSAPSTLISSTSHLRRKLGTGRAGALPSTSLVQGQAWPVLNFKF